ncbi:MAG: ComEA family DNA-binding protein [Chloroflexi bacterium]|nr:ComEA family DNA-binding protein [Chloroflexota bacterium]
MKTSTNIVLGILAGLLLAGVLWVVASPPRGEPVALLPPPTQAPLSVYVTGAVLHQGVYDLPQGSRVEDAVEAAGGFLPIADKEHVNLAAALEDGEQVIVPRLEFSNSGADLDRVNINTAAAEELDALPGIGPSLAQQIVDYRRQYGSFRKIDDIMGVPGIGPATFDRIKDLITTGY